jgi:hypothetical protein
MVGNRPGTAIVCDTSRQMTSITFSGRRVQALDQHDAATISFSPLLFNLRGRLTDGRWLEFFSHGQLRRYCLEE